MANRETPWEYDLPEWLQEVLPKRVSDYAEIMLDGDKIVVRFAYTGVEETFEDADLAGKFLRDNETRAYLSLKDGEIIPRKVLGYHYPMSERVRLEIMEEDYKLFKRTAERYHNDSDDFEKAYFFVDSHPAFWYNLDKDPETPSFIWQTSDYTQSNGYSLEVFFRDGGHYWAVDGGEHILNRTPGGPTHYLNQYMSSEGGTAEEAIVNFAKKVALCFNDDGTYRHDFEEES